MSSVFDEIKRERAALLKAIAEIDAATVERQGTIGEWSVKDVMAHIAGWQDWMLRALPARLTTGQIPDDLRALGDNTEALNRRFVEERRQRPAAKVVEEMADGLHRLLTYAANLGATRLDEVKPWPGRDGSIADYLRENLVHHDRGHRDEIIKAVGRH